LRASADAPSLIHALAAILACVRRVDQQMDLAGTCRRFDLVRAVDQIAGPRLHAEAIERGLAQRMLGPLTEIGRNVDVVGLEGPLEGALELAFGIRRIELGAGNADPDAAARRLRPNIRRNAPVWTEREPDQL